MPELILRLALVIAETVKLAMESQPPEVRAELWRIHLEDLKAWREFWKPIATKFKPQDPPNG